MLLTRWTASSLRTPWGTAYDGISQTSEAARGTSMADTVVNYAIVDAGHGWEK